jgi:hypothetical protein
MEFSKNSWHYKLACHGNSSNLFESNTIRGQINLCPYVWMIIFGLLKLVLSGIVISLFLLSAAGGIYAVFSMLMLVFSGLTGIYLHDIVQEDLGMISLVVTLTFTVLTFCGGVGEWFDNRMYFFPKYITKYFPKKSETVIKAKEPSIVVEWVKAKKNKVCPIITFKE